MLKYYVIRFVSESNKTNQKHKKSDSEGKNDIEAEISQNPNNDKGNNHQCGMEKLVKSNTKNSRFFYTRKNVLKLYS